MILLIFQILSSTFGFFNKLFLFLGKRVGWIIGFLAGIFFVVYFFLIGFYIYSVVQIGFCLLMLYGYFSHNNIPTVFRKIATIILSLTAIGIALITFNGHLTILEAISALLASWGTYFLASKSEFKGWISYLIAHVILVYLTFLKQQYLFVFFQAASAIIAIMAIIKYMQKQKVNL